MKAKKHMDKAYVGIILKHTAAKGQIQTLKNKFILVLVTDITVLSQNSFKAYMPILFWIKN